MPDIMQSELELDKPVQPGMMLRVSAKNLSDCEDTNLRIVYMGTFDGNRAFYVLDERYYSRPGYIIDIADDRITVRTLEYTSLLYVTYRLDDKGELLCLNEATHD